MFLHIGGNRTVLISDIVMIKRESDNSSTIIVNNGRETEILHTELTVKTLKKRIVE